jgi:FkbM family methyltransferase
VSSTFEREPGWYADVDAPPHRRYWDGGEWTEHRRLRRAALARSLLVALITRAAPERGGALARAVSSAQVGALRGGMPILGGLAKGIALAADGFPLTSVHAYDTVRGSLEVPMQEALRRSLGAGGVLFDVGASIGFFSLLGARLVGPTGSVVAFEPVPVQAEALRRNVAVNGWASIEVIEAAAASQTGAEILRLRQDAPVWSHLARYAPGAPGIDLAIEAVAIDDLVADGRVPAPSVVKLDVEGAELEVIEGMRQTLTRHRPILVCELHGTAPEFVDAMTEAGYRVTNLDGPAPLQEAGPNPRCVLEPA